MTDLLHKPKGQNDPIYQMSEEDWKEYFRLREELDVEYTKEELIKAFDKVDDLLEQNRFEDDDNLTAKLVVRLIDGLALKEVKSNEKGRVLKKS